MAAVGEVLHQYDEEGEAVSQQKQQEDIKQVTESQNHLPLITILLNREQLSFGA